MVPVVEKSGLDHRTWVLLHQVEGPVNLGSVCRAMANTGFANLAFSGDLQGDEGEARKFALHAVSILEGARKCSTLDGLTDGLDVVFGFSPRAPWPDGRNLDLDAFHTRFAQGLAAGLSQGLLFGNEARGLRNKDLATCHYRVALPTHEGYASMNLAQAVLVVLWEILRRQEAGLQTAGAPDLDRANPKQMTALLNNIHDFLATIEFLNPQNPDHIWQEVMPLFKARQWTQREVTLLHAVFAKGRSRYRAMQRRYEALKNGEHQSEE